MSRLKLAVESALDISMASVLSVATGVCLLLLQLLLGAGGNALTKGLHSLPVDPAANYGPVSL